MDLFEGQDPNAVLVCLSALARKGEKFGKTGLGPKEAEVEKREWSEEQLKVVARFGFVKANNDFI